MVRFLADASLHHAIVAGCLTDLMAYRLTHGLAATLESWQDRSVSPTVLQSGPYRLFFFSSDRGEPIHVHVARDRKAAKFWLQPVRLEYNHGFAAPELTKVD